MSAVTEAERAVAAILAALERETGSIVREIRLAAIETTTISSAGREQLMQVQIDLERRPGHRWAE